MNAEQTRIVAGLALLAGAAALYYWSTTQSGTDSIAAAADSIGDLVSGVPRGIRNNNPGNIIRNGIAWQGLLNVAEVQQRGWTWDPTFCQFDTDDDGLRALARILMTYASQGYNTVDALISHFSATDQAAYVKAVSSQLRVDPGAKINVLANITSIMADIVQQENGQQPYSQQTLIDAVAAASQA